jgi:transcriptional regulator with XRE-family HTH domain
MEFDQTLLNALIKWRQIQTKNRESVSLNSFADFLGISRPAVSQWLNKERTPGFESLIVIAPKLAQLLGPQVYDELGLSRPDQRFGELKELYDVVPSEDKDELLEAVRKILIERGWKKE